MAHFSKFDSHKENKQKSSIFVIKLLQRHLLLKRGNRKAEGALALPRNLGVQNANAPRNQNSNVDL